MSDGMEAQLKITEEMTALGEEMKLERKKTEP
jgi:hypothetical protein